MRVRRVISRHIITPQHVLGLVVVVRNREAFGVLTVVVAALLVLLSFHAPVAAADMVWSTPFLFFHPSYRPLVLLLVLLTSGCGCFHDDEALLHGPVTEEEDSQQPRHQKLLLLLLLLR